jgi:hypothetical protein
MELFIISLILVLLLTILIIVVDSRLNKIFLEIRETNEILKISGHSHTRLQRIKQLSKESAHK